MNMKTSINGKVTVVTTFCVALSGATAFAADDSGTTQTRAAPHPGFVRHANSDAPAGAPSAPSTRGSGTFYRPIPPHYPGKSALPHSTGQLKRGTPGLQNKPAVHRQPFASTSEGKLTSREPRPDQAPTTAMQKGDERAGNWSHSNRKGRSSLDRQSAARLRDWRGKGTPSPRLVRNTAITSIIITTEIGGGTTAT